MREKSFFFVSYNRVGVFFFFEHSPDIMMMRMVMVFLVKAACSTCSPFMFCNSASRSPGLQ